jgi:hypothetical protein
VDGCGDAETQGMKRSESDGVVGSYGVGLYFFKCCWHGTSMQRCSSVFRPRRIGSKALNGAVLGIPPPADRVGGTQRYSSGYSDPGG